MRKLLLAFLAFMPLAAFGQTYDNFSDLSHFTVIVGQFGLNSGGVFPIGGSTNEAVLSAGTFTNDQWSCMVYSSVNGNFVSPAVRMSRTTQTGYVTFISSTGYQIHTSNNSASTSSSTAPIAGHELCTIASGTNISIRDNTAGTTILTLTDASVAAGTPGLSAYGSGDPVIRGTGFRAGNGAVPGPPPAPATLSITQSTSNIQTGSADDVSCSVTYGVPIYNGDCAGTLQASNPPTVSIAGLRVKGQAAGTTNLTYTQAGLNSNSLSLTVFQHARVTWYIRPDGGTRWSAKRVSDGTAISSGSNTPVQCDGTHDAPFPASGTTNVLGAVSNGVNQPCAFNDYRFLYDDQTYGNSQ